MSTRIITGQRPEVKKHGYTYMIARFESTPMGDLEAMVRRRCRIPEEATRMFYSAGGVIGAEPDDQMRQMVFTWYEVTIA